MVPAGAVAPALDHAVALATAAAQAERAQRVKTAASVEAEAKAEHLPAAALPADSRFAGMGRVYDLPTQAPDLDDVLQRRRAAS
jgi:hypothetical protein